MTQRSDATERLQDVWEHGESSGCALLHDLR